MPGKINMFTWPPSLAAFKIYGTHDLPYTIFIFLQAYWYRFIVDAKIYETEKKKEDEKSIDFNGEISSGT